MPLSEDLTFTVDSQTIFVVVVVVLDLGEKKKKKKGLRNSDLCGNAHISIGIQQTKIVMIIKT